jgi:hypothetical protein
MSRYTKELSRKENQIFVVSVAYGYDPITGYFFQVFDENEGDGDNDYLVLDECSCFTNMSKARMVELMEEYEVDKSHIEKVALDMPI